MIKGTMMPPAVKDAASTGPGRETAMRTMLKRDWHAIAGVVAAVVALVLHPLHVVDQDVILMIILVILALAMLRDLHHESRDEGAVETLESIHSRVSQLVASQGPLELELVGPRRLRETSREFARKARGRMVWYNVCLSMFVPQDLFDEMLRPAVENPHVDTIQFGCTATQN